MSGVGGRESPRAQYQPGRPVYSTSHMNDGLRLDLKTFVRERHIAAQPSRLQIHDPHA